MCEQDRSPGRSDNLGSLTFDLAYQNMGEFPYHIYHGRAHYILTAEVTEGSQRPERYTVDLIRLVCTDTRQATDHVYLKVNGEQV